ncbi:MAG TPA: dTDP-4-dehydrorhamnose reductase [Mycobacteriales bacterium]|nr:dTDP-4-dehydrorhamnose reductase [Mycobacteriales bacterium]
MSLALLVTGAGGQLGQALLGRAHRAADVAFARGLDRAALDLTDPFSVRDVVAEWVRVVRSDSSAHRLVVVNCAAYTAVDAAETEEDAAYAANAAGPAVLATACAELDVRLVHVSTDYVFAGDATSPYEVEHPTGPRTAYGRTKLAGEQAVLSLHPSGSQVVRTAWVYGGAGANFVRTMAALERSRDTISVVDDQVGSPTWTGDLADGLLALCRSDAPAGTYHATNAGAVSWCGFARAVFEELGADPARVLPTDTASFPRPAPRPAYSVLSGSAWVAAGLPPLRGWREALTAAFAEEGDALRS